MSFVGDCIVTISVRIPSSMSLFSRVWYLPRPSIIQPGALRLHVLLCSAQFKMRDRSLTSRAGHCTYPRLGADQTREPGTLSARRTQPILTTYTRPEWCNKMTLWWTRAAEPPTSGCCRNIRESSHPLIGNLVLGIPWGPILCDSGRAFRAAAPESPSG